MIKVTVQYNDHLVDIHFPCSETTLHSALMEIHAADDNPPELFIKDVVFPEELGHLTEDYDVRRASMFLKLLRFSYSSS